ncbi:hypothetical protein JCM17961_13980 [Endothiovibrio diazotrophicus]
MVAGALLAGATARAASEAEEDGAELLNLLNILEEQTEIATKTKLNADYVPGMVTVLHGDDLEARGVATVWEALGLVPGMELSMDRIGERLVAVRGIGGSILSGNLKILLDDVAMNSAYGAMAVPVFDLPVEQVERIELIRGPGSAIHGEFAYAGVVNVVTRHEGQRVYTRFGQFGERHAGASTSWEAPSGALKFNLNVAGTRGDGADLSVPSDALFGAGQAAVSNAPGSVNEVRKFEGVLFSMEAGRFSLIGQWLEDRHGDHFGPLNVLPTDDGTTAYRNGYRTIEGRYHDELSAEAAFELKVGWQRYRHDADVELLPPGYVFPHILFPGAIVYPDGWSEHSRYQEERLHGSLDFTWKGWHNHAVLAGLSLTGIDVEESRFDTEVDPATLVPLGTLTRFYGREAHSRNIVALTLQDEYRLNDDVTVTLGLRHDDYDDVGEKFSPRLAAVWRIDRSNILKAQYAEAFRPPTFFELSRTPTIQPQLIETTEVGYIHRSSAGVGRLTLFNSRLKDRIFENNLAVFSNTSGARTRGVELELERQLGPKWKVNANLTLASTEEDLTGEAMPGAAQRLLNLGLIYRPAAEMTWAAQWRYVGGRERQMGDTRAKIGDYHTLGVTGTFAHLAGSGLTLRVGVDNLLDEEVRYPAALTGDLLGNVFPSYADDYPQPGRYLWAQVGYDF